MLNLLFHNGIGKYVVMLQRAAFLNPVTAVLLWLLLLLGGCNTAALYQDDIYNPAVYWGQHVVRQGETLYSIAWRYGRDFRELGTANGIQAPWTIRKGQVLRLDKRGRAPAKTIARAPGQGNASPPRGANASAPKPVPKPVITRKPDKTAPLASQVQTAANIQWRWPHSGTVIADFSGTGKVNKGIDIAGQSGDSVRAAASGNVVYAGSGLLGYGNLVIVNHSEQYLSAYGHNRKIRVKEGENVQAGQVIAELGSSGTERAMLHFEIRKNGNPVNPTYYLPAR